MGSGPALEAALADSAAAGLPPIQVSPAQGKLLHLLARVRGARTVLEIGTLGGYSTIWLARALPADGRLVSLEIDPGHAAVARASLERAGLTQVAEVRVGPAAETLAALAEEDGNPFDLVFVDADKPSPRSTPRPAAHPPPQPSQHPRPRSTPDPWHARSALAPADHGTAGHRGQRGVGGAGHHCTDQG